MNQGLYDKVKLFIKKIDPSSWPAFIMFGIVLLAAGGLNYLGMSPVTGGPVAVMVALFFGFGVLSWHIVESRTDDSKYQEDVAQIVKWVNVILDGSLIFVNLFREDLRSRALIDGLSTWDTFAYLIVGISAASHVVGFLLWTQNDPRRIAKKSLERGMNELSQKADRASVQIKTTEEHMKKLKWINDESIRLRGLYSGVPGIDVEVMIEAMKNKALAEFQDVKPQDIGNTKVQPTVKRLETSRQFGQDADFTDRQSQK